MWRFEGSKCSHRRLILKLIIDQVKTKEITYLHIPLLVEMLSNSTGVSPSVPAAISSCRDTICNESTAE